MQHTARNIAIVITGDSESPLKHPSPEKFCGKGSGCLSRFSQMCLTMYINAASQLYDTEADDERVYSRMLSSLQNDSVV